MSSEKEKIKAIKHAINHATKEVKKLELIKSISKLSRGDEFKLNMAIETVKSGERILKIKGWNNK